MSTHLSAFDHKAWAEAHLLNYEDFSDRITECNQKEYGDDCLEGDWFFIPDEAIAEGEYKGCRVIYSGSFGNYNSPGASSYTYADIYEPDEEKDFAVQEAVGNAAPEFADVDDEDDSDWEEDDEEDDDEDWEDLNDEDLEADEEDE